MFLVEGDGFEPSKSLTTDLQSAPFGLLGIPPLFTCTGSIERDKSYVSTASLSCQYVKTYFLAEHIKHKEEH
jgi:hypothetical protein